MKEEKLKRAERLAKTEAIAERRLNRFTKLWQNPSLVKGKFKKGNSTHSHHGKACWLCKKPRYVREVMDWSVDEKRHPNPKAFK